MIDHFFSAALTFCLLCAGTAAIGSLLLEPAAAKQTQVRVIEPPRVVITAKRLAPSTALARSDPTELAAARVQ